MAEVSVLPIIPNLLRQKLTHTATLDTTQTRLFCRVWCGGVYWVGPTAWQVRSVSGLCRSVSGGAMRPPYALGRRTHLSGRLNSHRHIRQDETVAPACRPPPRRRLHRQPRLAARPSTRSDIVRHAKRKHAVDCCVIWLNLNLFTKFHATRVIYRLTVQTLPDGWRQDRLTRHRQDRLVLSGGRCELGTRHCAADEFSFNIANAYPGQRATGDTDYRSAGSLWECVRCICVEMSGDRC